MGINASYQASLRRVFHQQLQYISSKYDHKDPSLARRPTVLLVNSHLRQYLHLNSHLRQYLQVYKQTRR